LRRPFAGDRLVSRHELGDLRFGDGLIAVAEEKPPLRQARGDLLRTVASKLEPSRRRHDRFRIAGVKGE
jgi:hypothetical protein